MSLPDPAALTPLLQHLSTYGEFYSAELNAATQAWIPYLVQTGWLYTVDKDIYSTTASLLSKSNTLPDLEMKRLICFSIPIYRRYLLAILAEGLVAASQVEYYDTLEEWITGALAHLAHEINQLIDELEAGDGRIVEWSSTRVTDRFERWHRQYESFAGWDSQLLGLSNTPTQLFTAVLRHATSFVTPPAPEKSHIEPLALLPEFDIQRESTGNMPIPLPIVWTIKRQSVYSSLSFFDINGHAFYDKTQPNSVIWQDVLAQQPYYRAVLRTGIAARLSSYGATPLILFVPDDLSNTQVQSKARGTQTLATLLADLVRVMGFRIGTILTPSQVGRIVEHWLKVDVLELHNGILSLQEDYARTLHERRRATMLLRGQAKEEQNRVEAYLMRMM